MTKAKLSTNDLLKSDGGKTITQEELTALQAQADKVADLEKSVEAKNALETEVVELRKAKEDAAKVLEEVVELRKAKEDLQKAKDAQRKEEMDDLVKGYTFVLDEDREAVSSVLLKAKDEDAALLVSTLEKAKNALTEAVTQEQGHDLEGTVETDTQKSTNLVSDLLKQRKADAKA